MANILEKIGSRIRTHRKQAELSQQALAERANVSYKYIGEIERGQVNLSVEILLKITGALNVEAGELLGEKKEAARLSKAKYILSELPEKELAMAVDMLELLKRHSTG